MNFLKRISKLIVKINPFGKKKIYAKQRSKKDLIIEILKIEKSQEFERKSIKKNVDSSIKRVENLSTKQNKLINQKIEIFKKLDFAVKVERLIELDAELELLKTNLVLQSRYKFEIKPINQILIDIISKKLRHYKSFKIDNSKLKKQQKKIIETREAEKEEISELKDKVLKFSLIKIHKDREANLYKQKLLKIEEKLEEEYRRYIDNYKKNLSNNNFKNAEIILNNALKVRPKRKKEIKRLIKKINKSKIEYNKKNQKFTSLFKLAEKNFHSGKLEIAIELYKKARKLNINTHKCNNRINYTYDKILKIKLVQEKQSKKDQVRQEFQKKYKSDANQIVEFYKANGISQFYHYTDSRNLNSILQNKGLLSLDEMKNKGVAFYQGSETCEYPDFIRLSYTKNHPLLYISKQKGRIRQEKNLIIDIKTAKLINTKFTNVNAARTSRPPIAKFGSDLNFIKNNVKINIVKQKNYLNLNDEEKAYYQAEIMVKKHIPLEYIKNL